MPDSALSFTSMIVSSFLGKNQISKADLSALIQTVHTALTQAAAPAPDPEAPQEPAVSLRKSVTPDAIICMNCGKPFKSLRRHLDTAHNLSPAAYREKWSLPKTYPMVAQIYFAARSAFAKSIGLGARGQTERPAETFEGPGTETTPKTPPDALPSSIGTLTDVQGAEEVPATTSATARAAPKPTKAAAQAKPHPKPSSTRKPKRTRAAKSAET